MAKWIEFTQTATSPSGKTKVWSVHAKDGGPPLGSVRWHGAWRRYSFFPEPGTLFEKDCLRDIANFLETQTEAQRRPATELAEPT